MWRGRGFGVLLLGVQLLQEGLSSIPSVTLGVLGINVYLHMFPIAPLSQACLGYFVVYWRDEWRRILLAPLYHVDELHLCFNMSSFLWKGVRMERRLGGVWFLYLLSVFTVLTSLVYLLLQGALTKHFPELHGLTALSLINECVVGFSGVLFALKVVNNHFYPGGETYVLNIRVSNRFASWVELLLIYVFVPSSSLLGHFAGILVGLLYTVGPLKTIMWMFAGIVPLLQHYLRSAREFFRASGFMDGLQYYLPFARAFFRSSEAAHDAKAEQAEVEEEEEEAVDLEELRKKRMKRLERGNLNRRRRGTLL